MRRYHVSAKPLLVGGRLATCRGSYRTPSSAPIRRSRSRSERRSTVILPFFTLLIRLERPAPRRSRPWVSASTALYPFSSLEGQPSYDYEALGLEFRPVLRSVDTAPLPLQP